MIMMQWLLPTRDCYWILEQITFGEEWMVITDPSIKWNAEDWTLYKVFEVQTIYTR